ncbi:nucleotidyltransferase family protein [Microbacterium sp. GXF7504]
MDRPTAGLVLAAGAGTRFGGPKGLARTPDGRPWVGLAVDALRGGGCGPVLVAVGAEADEVGALVLPGVQTVPVADWADGLAATVRAGLAAAAATDAGALLIVTVDTPDLPDAAVHRIRSLAAPDALAQAVYDGRPGHPVLVGRDHWGPLAADLEGDRGAGPYLRAHGAVGVECADLWSGADIDRRPHP